MGKPEIEDFTDGVVVDLTAYEAAKLEYNLKQASYKGLGRPTIAHPDDAAKLAKAYFMRGVRGRALERYAYDLGLKMSRPTLYATVNRGAAFVEELRGCSTKAARAVLDDYQALQLAEASLSGVTNKQLRKDLLIRLGKKVTSTTLNRALKRGREILSWRENNDQN